MLIGVVTKDTFKAVNDTLLQEIVVVSLISLSRDKVTIGNIHGYVKKQKETTHDI